jgi:hypothetical protein
MYFTSFLNEVCKFVDLYSKISQANRYFCLNIVELKMLSKFSSVIFQVQNFMWIKQLL